MLTNSREVAGFFIARTIVIAVLFFATPVFLTPLYTQLLRAGGAGLMTAATLGVGLVMWLITLLLFVLLRGGLGGVPPTVDARQDAVISSAAEIGAFLISVLIVTVLISAVSAAVLAPIYASLRQSGGTASVVPVSLTFSAVSAVVFFLIFIALRGGMSGSASSYYGGGSSMGFGQAVATCFRKYAVFSGRASRSEYWYFVLFQILVFIVLLMVDSLVLRTQVSVLSMLAWLLMILPWLAVLVRRLHDTDKRGWFVLIWIVPLVGPIIVIVFLCQRGTDGPNRFGMGPAEVSIPQVFA
jgi:uncharacterized membrane protein YhaH (DUF805 family)